MFQAYLQKDEVALKDDLKLSNSETVNRFYKKGVQQAQKMM